MASGDVFSRREDHAIKRGLHSIKEQHIH